ncbi:MAG: hypothetical protein ACI4TM_04340, partial [Candidatus Cryptobacteroides sp.]
MSDMVKCPSCNKDVKPESFGGKMFCPECGNEIVAAKPAEGVGQTVGSGKPAPGKSQESAGAPESGASIKDGMGIIENSRNKVGAVESFSDNSVTNNTTNTTTNNISNITQIEDDTKKSVICEISGKRILVTSSVKCPVCGKTVSSQYYNEAKLRCAACEKKAVSEYEEYYKQMTSGVRAIDKELRQVLDAKAKELKLTPEQTKESEIRLRKSGSGKSEHLSDMKQKDFVRTINQFANGEIGLEACINKVSAYAKVTEDDAVQCWHHFLWAISKPSSYRKELAEATMDNYWQIYWDFVAAIRLNNTAEAVNAVDNTREKYPERINDVIFSQILLNECQSVITKDKAYLDDAEEDKKSLGPFESPCLADLLNYDAVFTYFIVNGEIPKRPQPAPAQQQAPQKPVQQPQKPVQQAPQKPAQPQQRPAVQTPQKPAQQPQKPSQPASQKPDSMKGIVMNNSAGGPLNPQVSFDNTGKQKGKGGKAGIGIAVAAVIVAAVAGFAIFGGKPSDEPKPQQEVAADTPKTEQKEETVPMPEQTPAKVEEPKTLAGKAKEKETASMADAAAAKASETAASAAPCAEEYAQA